MIAPPLVVSLQDEFFFSVDKLAQDSRGILDRNRCSTYPASNPCRQGIFAPLAAGAAETLGFWPEGRDFPAAEQGPARPGQGRNRDVPAAGRDCDARSGIVIVTTSNSEC